jgi:hypothetical protein
MPDQTEKEHIEILTQTILPKLHREPGVLTMPDGVVFRVDEWCDDPTEEEASALCETIVCDLLAPLVYTLTQAIAEVRDMRAAVMLADSALKMAEIMLAAQKKALDDPSQCGDPECPCG